MKTDWRLDVRLKDRQLLERYIGPDGLNISGRELARRARLGQAIVGHLISGRRTTCSKSTAVAIERALGCPNGLLFVESVSAVRPDGKRVRELARIA
jgi:hypothetical protein